MITVQFPDVGTLGFEFEVPESQPNYWQERLAWNLLRLLKSLRDNSIEIKQVETSDVQTQVDALNTAIQSAYNGIDGLYVEEG